MTNNLSKEGAYILLYRPPVCEVILEETQRVICESESETELVGEIEGEW